MSFDKEYYINKILTSSEFTNSGKYFKLLKYLINAALDGNSPKEVTIASDVFNVETGKDSLHEASIRVYIHNLRKKLDTYYVNEGKEDKIILKIPKGRYMVEFHKRDNPFRPKTTILISLSVLTILMAVLNILFIRDKHGRKIFKSNTDAGLIWGNFVNNDQPVLIVIGDYYLISDKSSNNRVRFLRDSKINSDNDFEEYIEENPELKDTHINTKHTFLGKFAPLCINELAEFFNSYNKTFEIIMSSDFKWQDLQKYNVIFLGSFKTLRLFNLYLKNSNFKFNIFPNELILHSLDPDTTFHYFAFDSDVNNAYESDYPIITMVPGPNQHKVLLFIASRDIGLIAATKFFTDIEEVKAFENEHFMDYKDSIYFETCFKVKGLQRNVISIDLLNINHLNSSTIFQISPPD